MIGIAVAVLLQIAPVTPPKTIKNFLPGKTPRDTTRNYIVLHNDGGNLNASATRLVLRARRLAYHFFIDKKGTIYQFMDLKYKAKHAGDTRWEGLTNFNSFSIGVALQGTDYTNYTCSQYKSLKKLVDYINLRYPDSAEKPLLGHGDVAWPRGRKHDPGPHFETWRLHNDTTCIA